MAYVFVLNVCLYLNLASDVLVITFSKTMTDETPQCIGAEIHGF